MNKLKQWFKSKINSFSYNYSFLKVLNSPFVGLKLSWYFGEISKGTPYFLPRKWVKCNIHDAEEAWNALSDRVREAYEKAQGKEAWIYNYLKCRTKAIPIKYFGWQFTSLGWKTKWSEYRFEWSPSLSIVIFGKQLFIEILPNCKPLNDRLRIDCYWESWLNWESTNKSLSKEERFKELIKKHSNTWGSEKDGWTDYYLQILNKKYLKLYKELNNIE